MILKRLLGLIRRPSRTVPTAGPTCKGVEFSSLPSDAKQEVMDRAARRFWKEYGSVITRLANE